MGIFPKGIVFDTNITYMIDCELWYQLFLKYGHPKNTDEIGIVIRVGNHSLTSQWESESVNMIENEKVQVVNINNGERLETYVIKGERGSGMICLNGPAARKAATGDSVIIISYCIMDFEEAKKYTPIAIYPDHNNKLTH